MALKGLACLGHHAWGTEWKARGCWRPEAGPGVLWVTHHSPPGARLHYPGALQGVAPSGGPAGVGGSLAQGLVVPDRAKLADTPPLKGLWSPGLQFTLDSLPSFSPQTLECVTCQDSCGSREFRTERLEPFLQAFREEGAACGM